MKAALVIGMVAVAAAVWMVLAASWTSPYVGAWTGVGGVTAGDRLTLRRDGTGMCEMGNMPAEPAVTVEWHASGGRLELVTRAKDGKMIDVEKWIGTLKGGELVLSGEGETAEFRRVGSAPAGGK